MICGNLQRRQCCFVGCNPMHTECGVGSELVLVLSVTFRDTIVRCMNTKNLEVVAVLVWRRIVAWGTYFIWKTTRRKTMENTDHRPSCLNTLTPSCAISGDIYINVAQVCRTMAAARELRGAVHVVHIRKVSCCDIIVMVPASILRTHTGWNFSTKKSGYWHMHVHQYETAPCVTPLISPRITETGVNLPNPYLGVPTCDFIWLLNWFLSTPSHCQRSGPTRDDFHHGKLLHLEMNASSPTTTAVASLPIILHRRRSAVWRKMSRSTTPSGICCRLYEWSLSHPDWVFWSNRECWNLDRNHVSK